MTDDDHDDLPWHYSVALVAKTAIEAVATLGLLYLLASCMHGGLLK